MRSICGHDQHIESEDDHVELLYHDRSVPKLIKQRARDVGESDVGSIRTTELRGREQTWTDRDEETN